MEGRQAQRVVICGPCGDATRVLMIYSGGKQGGEFVGHCHLICTVGGFDVDTPCPEMGLLFFLLFPPQTPSITSSNKTDACLDGRWAADLPISTTGSASLGSSLLYLSLCHLFILTNTSLGPAI
jgi:hypothetical protein